jgi:pimeloyl-ACP methyl ester carboxylesterase
MLAVTLPGFEGTAAPPMPAPGVSYGEQTWTRQAVDAVVKLIADRKLQRPVLVGHFINGTQVAMRVALEHPELVRGVVLLAGTPRFEPAQTSRFWPKDMTAEQKVKAVDLFTAPRWFKTVTRDTWVKGNFVGGDYSVVDSARGRRFADLANQPPLPVLIRWLCEFHASDLWPELPKLQTPLLVLRPGFTPALAADTTRNYLGSYFEEPWKGRLDRAGVETEVIPGAGMLLMDDQPGIVDRRVAEFVKRRK